MAIPIMDTDFHKADELLATTGIDYLRQQIAVVIATERERCAKVAQSFQRSHKDFSVALDIANAIRKADDAVGGSR